MLESAFRPIGLVLIAALVAWGLARPLWASEEVRETIGAWILECGKTEAGGRGCEIRNDEGGKAALEQSRLFQIILHQGKTEADGLVRVTDLELKPRLPVEIAYGGGRREFEGVGRRGRLAVRFNLQKQELGGLAAGESITVRFADKADTPQEIEFPTAGLAEALAKADGFL